MRLFLRRSLVPQTPEGALSAFVLYSSLGDGGSAVQECDATMLNSNTEAWRLIILTNLIVVRF